MASNTTPNPPTGITAIAVAYNQINLSWIAPSNNGGSAITGYKVEYKIGSGTYSVLVANTGTATTKYSNKGVQIRPAKVVSLQPMKLSLGKPAIFDKNDICVIVRPESQTIRIVGSGAII